MSEFLIHQIFTECLLCPLTRVGTWPEAELRRTGPSGSRVEGKVKLTPDQAWDSALRPPIVVNSEGSTQHVPVRIRCICLWPEAYVSSGLKTQGFIFSWTRTLDQSWYVFHEAVRDPGSNQLATWSLLECGPHLPSPRWLPDLQPSHIHSRRKGRSVYFLPFKKVWEI